MKKVFVLLFAVIAASSSFAQYKGGHSDDVDKKNVVKINPLGLIFGAANVSYERVINAKSSVQLDVIFGGLNIGGVKYTTIGGGLDYKYYLSNSKPAPEGFYVAPGVGFTSVKVKDPYETVSGTSVNIKAVVGNQWIYSSGFSLDIFAGINYYAGGKIKGTGNVEYSKFNGVLPALGVALGYAF